jgi:hypothetical protein
MTHFPHYLLDETEQEHFLRNHDHSPVSRSRTQSRKDFDLSGTIAIEITSPRIPRSPRSRSKPTSSSPRTKFLRKPDPQTKTPPSNPPLPLPSPLFLLTPQIVVEPSRKLPGKDKETLLSEFPFHETLPLLHSTPTPVVPPASASASASPTTAIRSLAAQREEDEKASLLMEIRRSKDELFASLQKDVSVFREELANLKSSESCHQVSHQTIPIPANVPMEQPQHQRQAQSSEKSEELVKQEWREIKNLRSELYALINSSRNNELSPVTAAATAAHTTAAHTPGDADAADFTDPHFHWSLNEGDAEEEVSSAERQDTVDTPLSRFSLSRPSLPTPPNSFKLTEQSKEQLRQMNFTVLPIPSSEFERESQEQQQQLELITDPTYLRNLLLSAVLSENLSLTKTTLSLLMKTLLSHSLIFSQQKLQFISELFPDISVLLFLMRIFHPFDPLLRSILCLVSFIICIEPPSSALALISAGISEALLTLLTDLTLAEDLLQKSISLLTILIGKHAAATSSTALETEAAVAAVREEEEKQQQEEESEEVVLFDAPLDYERLVTIFVDLIQSTPSQDEEDEEDAVDGKGTSGLKRADGLMTVSLYLQLLSSLCSQSSHLKHLQSSSLVQHKLFQAMTLLSKANALLLCRLLNLILPTSSSSSLASTMTTPPPSLSSTSTSACILIALDLCIDRCLEILSLFNEQPQPQQQQQQPQQGEQQREQQQREQEREWDQEREECLQYSLLFFSCAQRIPEKLFYRIPSARYLKFGLFFRAILSSHHETPQFRSLSLLSTALSILELATVYKEILILSLESHLAMYLEQLYPFLLLSSLTHSHVTEDLKKTVRILHSRITGQDRRYLLALYHPSCLSPTECEMILQSSATTAEAAAEGTEGAIDQTITVPKIRRQSCSPLTSRRASAFAPLPTVPSASTVNRFRRISSFPLSAADLNLISAGAAPSSSTTAAPNAHTAADADTAGGPATGAAAAAAGARGVLGAAAVEETKQLASEIIQRSLLKEYKKKYNCLVLNSTTQALSSAQLSALQRILPNCCDLSFLTEAISVCQVTRNESLSLLLLQRITRVSVEKRSLLKKLSIELLKKIDSLLELLLLFQENDEMLSEGCSVLLIILTHPPPPVPSSTSGLHSSSETLTLLSLWNETSRILVLQLFYSSLQRIHSLSSPHSNSTPHSNSSPGATPAFFSNDTIATLCLQILAMGVKFVKIKPPKDLSSSSSSSVSSLLSEAHDFGLLIQLLKLYSYSLTSLSHSSPAASASRAVSVSSFASTSDRIVESLCQFLCYCIQAHPPCQDLIRKHSGCEVLVTLLSGETSQDETAGAGGGVSMSTLQTVSHLVTNLMTRNNKNIHFFISQQNLTQYFCGMEKAIKALNSSMLYGLTSLVCHIFSKPLTLYAMFHPELEAELDLTGPQQLPQPQHPSLSHPPLSAATKIHIPSHLSKLIDLILDHTAAPTLAATVSSVSVGRGALSHAHHGLFTHLSDDQMRVLHELIYSILKLIEFFSTQHILKTSFRSHRAVLAAVTSMTVESRLYSPKITELAKKVAAYLRAC